MFTCITEKVANYDNNSPTIFHQSSHVKSGFHESKSTTVSSVVKLGLGKSPNDHPLNGIVSIL